MQNFVPDPHGHAWLARWSARTGGRRGVTRLACVARLTANVIALRS
ncbi:hypothetical protein RR42_s1875 [Cupriavidus basilensis]|uniref:Uncharacterized protein n=1 Tax=Cupriavidus basilensis TaxID=68895 RepID=A0A0C4YK65_9BURK|nr:hypothetical protein RR42_s1875 [Cupriavidus basilensis]